VSAFWIEAAHLVQLQRLETRDDFLSVASFWTWATADPFATQRCAAACAPCALRQMANSFHCPQRAIRLRGFLHRHHRTLVFILRPGRHLRPWDSRPTPRFLIAPGGEKSGQKKKSSIRVRTRLCGVPIMLPARTCDMQFDDLWLFSVKSVVPAKP